MMSGSDLTARTRYCFTTGSPCCTSAGGGNGATGPTGPAGPAGTPGDRFITSADVSGFNTSSIVTGMTLTVGSGLAYISGNSVVVVDRLAPTTNRFEATVQLYSGMTLTLRNPVNIVGFVSPAAYTLNVNLDGIDGPTGATGPIGPVAGLNQQIIFNAAGDASGSPNLLWNYSANEMNVNGKLNVTGLITSAGVSSSAGITATGLASTGGIQMGGITTNFASPVTTSHYIYNFTATPPGTTTANLPTSVGITGHQFLFVNSGAPPGSTITIQTTSGQIIYGAGTANATRTVAGHTTAIVTSLGSFGWAMNVQ